MNEQIERIVEQACKKAKHSRIQVEEVVTLAARLAYVAGMREAARIAKGMQESEHTAGGWIGTAIESAADAIERGE